MKDKPEFTSTYKSVSKFRIEIITASIEERSSNADQEFVQVNYLKKFCGESPKLKARDWSYLQG